MFIAQRTWVVANQAINVIGLASRFGSTYIVKWQPIDVYQNYIIYIVKLEGVKRPSA